MHEDQLDQNSNRSKNSHLLYNHDVLLCEGEKVKCVCGHVTFSVFERDIWKEGRAKTLSSSCNIFINAFILTSIYLVKFT